MWRLRERIAEVAGASGAARFIYSTTGARRNSLRILAYHRVLDIPPEDSFPDDPELVSAGVADFAWQMKFVKRHFTPMRLSEVIRAIDSGSRLPPRSVVVTFDDGHFDNYTNAFPILQDVGIPATIFLSTDYIGTGRPFWFDRVMTLLYFAPAGRLQVRSAQVDEVLTDVASRRRTGALLVKTLKRTPDPLRQAMLDEVEELLGGLVPPSLEQRPFAMSWDQVGEMAGAGIEFGSHAMSHQVLTVLDDDALDHELRESRRLIQAQTGQAVDTIAYPVGSADAYDERVISYAKACGYRLGVSYRPGINPMDRLERFALTRLRVERYISQPKFQSLLCLPGVLE